MLGWPATEAMKSGGNPWRGPAGLRFRGSGFNDFFGHLDFRGVGFRGVTGSAKVVYTKQDCVAAVSRPHNDLKPYWSSPSTQHFNPTDLFEQIFQVHFLGS